MFYEENKQTKKAPSSETFRNPFILPNYKYPFAFLLRGGGGKGAVMLYRYALWPFDINVLL